MTQETRKDPRAKIVSLNVRYKSATVDEFIENHSHDVSRGGIFIKTTSPFPSGTLLKFEIRIQGDKAVIMGVGRVVWKRDGTQAGPERPAGMGVKFIKLDDASRALIERLSSSRADAGRHYEAGVPAEGKLGQAGKQTIMGVGGPGGATPSTPAVGDVAAKRAAAGKSTMMGTGADPGMFPKAGGELDMPPKGEQTVMKQAAELLEEALKEAGGSLDEIGQNPLFSSAKESRNNAPTPAVGSPSVPPPGAVPTPEPTKAPAADAFAPTVPLGGGIASGGFAAGGSRPAPTARPASNAPAAAAVAAPEGRPMASLPPPKSSGVGPILVGALVIAIGAVVYLYRGTLMGTPAVPVPSAEPIASVEPPAPSALASAAPSAESLEIDEAPEAGAPAASASASASAAPAVTTPPPPAPTPRPAPPPPPPKPVVVPVAPPVTATPPSDTPSSPPTTTATTTTPATEAPTTAPTPPPAPKPKPKTKDDTDNPY